MAREEEKILRAVEEMKKFMVNVWGRRIKSSDKNPRMVL